MPLGPDPYAAESFAKAQPKLGQLILHSGRDDRENGTHYKPVRFHLAKRLGQHFLAHPANQFTQAGETQPAVLAEHFEGKHGPLLGDPSDDLANQASNSGSSCCGGPACVPWWREDASGIATELLMASLSFR
jgi:hypothetical protein